MALKKRVSYYYNPDTCTYQPAEPTTGLLIQRYSGYFLSIFALTFVAFYFYFNQFNTVKEEYLLEEQQELMAQIKDQNLHLAELGNELDDLFEKDNLIYNPMLNADKISRSVWEGGVGGTEAASKNNPRLEEKTELTIKALEHRIKLLRTNYEDLELLFEKVTKDLRKMPSILPVKGSFISGFGNRVHPINGGIHFHTGLDFKCAIGTPIYATGDGVVISAEDNSNGYGLNVDIDHLNGYETKYAHMSRLNVRNGQAVKRGDIVGYSGNSGMSTGPHLHYEIKEDGEKIDPLDFFYFDLLPGEFLQLKMQSKSESTSLDY
ncbi:MAG: M23 family metallopeptidase [Bacteroidia bacterium]|nr:M23 family metallopeptidase [Bacteroidia bacterium]